MIERRTIVQSIPPGYRRLVRTAVRLVEGVAFWAAVVLPFLHVPLLAMGLHTRSQRVAFFTLLALNAVAFVVGNGYADDTLYR